MADTESVRNGNPSILMFARVGRAVLGLLGNFGAMAIFFCLAFINIFRRKQLFEIVNQVYSIGARSSLIVMLVGLFTGMVLGLQLFYTLVKFGSVGALGSAVSLSLIRELGPVLTAIMITARAGSAMAAEIGILRISEQVDALYTMRIDPVRYLISPRVAASIISFPLLTAFFDLIGIFGGYISGVLLSGDKRRHILLPGTVLRGHRGRQGGIYQGAGLCSDRFHDLLLSGLFLPHADTRFWG